MSNYPLGSKYDSNAPYNQPYEDYVICRCCDGEGCLECDHNGYIPRTFEDDLADEEKAAEEKGDRIRNESHF